MNRERIVIIAITLWATTLSLGLIYVKYLIGIPIYFGVASLIIIIISLVCSLYLVITEIIDDNDKD
jgi:hypothetical protein